MMVIVIVFQYLILTLLNENTGTGSIHLVVLNKLESIR